MGAGKHGGFGKTYGLSAGDAIYKSEPTAYFDNISRRQDKDKNGFYDVVAHGGKNIIQITHNGKAIAISSRIAAKLIKTSPGYKNGQPVRLLSCNTGSLPNGFAQNLANKLNIIVEAPTKLVWAYNNGKYFVASRSEKNPERPNYQDKRKFINFYPGGNKK